MYYSNVCVESVDARSMASLVCLDLCNQLICQCHNTACTCIAAEYLMIYILIIKIRFFDPLDQLTLLTDMKYPGNVRMTFQISNQMSAGKFFASDSELWIFFCYIRQEFSNNKCKVENCCRFCLVRNSYLEQEGLDLPDCWLHCLPLQ